MCTPRTRLLSLALAAVVAAGMDSSAVAAQVDASVQDSPGWIGIRVAATEVRRTDGRVQTDVVITDVVDGTPADQAGFRPGDRIVQLNGRGVTLESFVRVASGLRAGDRVRLTLERGPWTGEMDVEAMARPARELVSLPQEVASRVDSAMLRLDSLLWILAGREISFERSRVALGSGDVERRRLVAIGADSTRTVIVPTWNMDPTQEPFRSFDAPESSSDLPLEPGAPSSWRSMFRQREVSTSVPSSEPGRLASPHILGQNRVAGAAVVLLNPELAAYFEVDGGLLVTDVTPGTPAADAGIRPGDVVIRVGSFAVASLSDLRRALSVPDVGGLIVGVVRRGDRIDVTLPR